jgi:hypothetical protein
MYTKAHAKIVATVALALSGLSLVGCGAKTKSEQEITASLPDLPQTEVAKMKPVPHTQMLATSEVQRLTGPPPEPAVHPDCAANAIESDCSAEVSYPITVCTFPSGVITGTFPGGPLEPTQKLDITRLSAEQKAVAGQSTQSVFWCKVHTGPWQAFLSSTKGCGGTCATDNILTLTSAPNLVVFQWYGSIIDDHPQVFQYVGKLNLLGTTNVDKCHAENVATPKH